MEPQPIQLVIQSRSWQILAASLTFGLFAAFALPFSALARIWFSQADYSHGMLVPFVAGYILWSRRNLIPVNIEVPNLLGILPIFMGTFLSVVGQVTNYGREFFIGIGFVLALTGCVIILFGIRSLRWAWPGLLFLIFMAKLPDRLEIQFMFKLRQVATTGSNFLLQCLGYPSYVAGDQGTVITIGDLKLGVEWACSGLSMVFTFVALATATVMLIRRPFGDRVFILLSAIPIAILSNVLRITVTAIVYIQGWKWLGDVIVHDLAGYFMMPLALGFLWLECRIIDWLMIPLEVPDMDTVLKTATNTQTGIWTAELNPRDRPSAPEVPR
ncbi:MAG: exosortase/archaeosortase family protein [Gemmataceae bacterium]